MAHINNTTANKIGTNLGDVKDIKKIGVTAERELYFAELHALFKIEFEQFMNDTSDEIAKTAQRLSELKSIRYGNRSSK